MRGLKRGFQECILVIRQLQFCLGLSPHTFTPAKKLSALDVGCGVTSGCSEPSASAAKPRNKSQEGPNTMGAMLRTPLALEAAAGGMPQVVPAVSNADSVTGGAVTAQELLSSSETTIAFIWKLLQQFGGISFHKGLLWEVLEQEVIGFPIALLGECLNQRNPTPVQHICSDPKDFNPHIYFFNILFISICISFFPPAKTNSLIVFLQRNVNSLRKYPEFPAQHSCKPQTPTAESSALLSIWGQRRNSF